MDDPDATVPLSKPTPQAGAGGLSPREMGGLLAAGAGAFESRHTARPRVWNPPSVEELQKLLPQYEISAFIACGGMGAVYKGVQPSLKRTVAIKILPPEIEDGEAQYVARFKHEAQAMARLSHPNIVAVFDAGEVSLRETGRGGEEETVRQGDMEKRSGSTLLYFVMEYIEGTDVAQLIAREGQLDPGRTVQIITAVCEALAFAHEEGIIHRDIKPSNIMIDRKGRVKVADFGLAKALNVESTLVTSSHIAMGTADFMAPEALIPGTLVDQRADLYAVGVMLYQMLTGRVPRGRFSPISAVVPKTDPKLDAIVDKAMQTDRERRYSTATELKRDVERITMSAGAQPPSPDKPTEANRRSWMMPALAAAAIFGAGALFVIKDKPAPTPVESAAPTAPWHLPDGEPGFVKEFAAEGHVRALAMMPDGRRVVSKHDIKRGNQTSVALIQWDVESGKQLWRREFPPFLGLDDSIVHLNGGNSMVVFQRNPVHALLALDSRTGDTLHETPIKGTQFYPKGPAIRTTMAVSPDGKSLLLALHASTEGQYGPVYLQVFDAGLQVPTGQWTTGSTVAALYGVDWLDNQRVIVGVNEMDATARLRQAIVDVSHPGNQVEPVPWEAGFDHFFAVIPGQPDRMLAHSEGNLAIVDVKTASVVQKWPGTVTQRKLRFLGKAHVLGLKQSTNTPERLTIWDIDTGTEVWKLPDPRIHDQIVVSPDGRYAVTNMLTEDSTPSANRSSGKIAVWRLPKLPEKPFVSIPGLPDLPPLTIQEGELGLVKEITLPSQPFLHRIALLPDSRRLLAFQAGKISLIDLETEAQLWSVDAGGDAVSTAVSQDGSRFAHYRFGKAAGASNGGTLEGQTAVITLRSTKDGSLLQGWTLPVAGMTVPGGSITLAPSGKRVVARVGGGSLTGAPAQFVALQEGQAEPLLRWSAPGHNSHVISCMDEDHFLSTGNGPAMLLSVPQGGKVEVFTPTGAELNSAVSPDGRLLVACYMKSGMALWNTLSKKRLLNLEGAPMQADLVTISRSGAVVIVGDSLLREKHKADPRAYSPPFGVWDSTTGKKLVSFQPTKPGQTLNGSSSVTVAANGTFMALPIRYYPPPPGGPPNVVQIWRMPLISVSTPAPPKTSAATGPAWPRMPTEEEQKLAYTNTLGMKFVPVPGTEVLFCIHETRKRDYAAFAAENEGVDISWTQATHGAADTPAGRGDDHPVVSVSWEDAQAFCAWLGRKEGRSYRLPTDREWSWAVGIGAQEGTDRDPIGLSQKVTGVHPWGTDWPPPARVANLADKAFLSCEPTGQIIEGYEDGFATTAPVMSFPPNALGIHDLGGNVWEWCEDRARNGGETRTARGAAFDTHKVPSLLSSYRVENLPGYRHELWGFRIVAEKQP